MRLVFAIGSACTLLASCRCQPSAPAPSAAASASAAAPASSGGSPRERQLLLAEQRRDSAAVTVDDLSNRDSRARRGAARALARVADDRAATLLASALADEDAEVVTWSAYGLGYACVGREAPTVRALVARAASLLAAETSAHDAASGLDTFEAIADALARCGTSDAERSLRAWLELPDTRAHHAALALGRLAARHKRLDDASIVALLDAASRPDAPISAALFAFSRLGGLPDSVQARLNDVATEALRRDEPARAFAVRALGRAGNRAIPKLVEVAGQSAYTPSERAHAIRELARLGPEGQNALGGLLPRLVPEDRALDQEHLVNAAYGPLSSALDGLSAGIAPARPTLERLAKLKLPEKPGAALRRRLISMRCAASALLASTSADARLLACDSDPKGRIGRLAQARVLDRGKLTGPRYQRWKDLAESSDPRVRQAAIALMPAHPEIAAPERVLAAALAAKEDGTVAAAAEVLRAYPDRASAVRREQRREGRGADRPETPEPAPVKADPGLIAALTRALETARAPDAIETRAALIDAAAALELLNLKRHIQADCVSDNPTLRERAEKALRLLGERGRTCKKFTPPERGPAELDTLLARATNLRFVTDVGELTMRLEPERAPVATTRIVELVRAGFFNGMVVHRVVPGFVVQFGDPGGDGYGGAGRPPLRCETAPLPFPPFSVGVALAGRDTGSSQIFVTLGRFPHLDGDYTLLGSAEPSWELVAEGDVIQSARAEP